MLFFEASSIVGDGVHLKEPGSIFVPGADMHGDLPFEQVARACRRESSTIAGAVLSQDPVHGGWAHLHEFLPRGLGQIQFSVTLEGDEELLHNGSHRLAGEPVREDPDLDQCRLLVGTVLACPLGSP